MEDIYGKFYRYWGDTNQTLSSLVVYEQSKPVFSSLALERGWRNNEPQVSSVPLGTWYAVFEYSPKFDMYLWEFKQIPDRFECKIHASNYWFNLNGCVALGRKLKDMNHDGYHDVTDSRNTIKEFHTVLRKYENRSIPFTFRNISENQILG